GSGWGGSSAWGGRSGGRGLQGTLLFTFFALLLFLVGLAFAAAFLGHVILQHGLQLGTGRDGTGLIRVGRNRNLLIRGVLQIEHLAFAGELVARIADIVLAAEFDISPLARSACLALELRGETVAVECHIFRQRCAAKLGKSAE